MFRRTERTERTGGTVTDEYQIPKRQVEAEVTLLGEAPRAIRLYLSETAQRHAGPERPRDLLNGPAAFIPAIDEEGRFLLLQREAISILSVAAEEEADGGTGELDLEEMEAELVQSRDVHLKLADGREIRGRVRYVRPEGQQRLQDFLNSVELFFAVHDGDSVHLVSRHLVTWIASD